jgi:hypothetical protein
MNGRHNSYSLGIYKKKPPSVHLALNFSSI